MESELVTNIDSMTAIFHHHNIINILISHFLIMTFLAHLHQIQLRGKIHHSPTHSHLGASGKHLIYLHWVLFRMKKPKEFVIYIFSSRTVLFTCGYWVLELWPIWGNKFWISFNFNEFKFKLTKRHRIQLLGNFYICLEQPGFVNPLLHMKIVWNLNTHQIFLMKKFSSAWKLRCTLSVRYTLVFKDSV